MNSSLLLPNSSLSLSSFSSSLLPISSLPLSDPATRPRRQPRQPGPLPSRAARREPAPPPAPPPASPDSNLEPPNPDREPQIADGFGPGAAPPPRVLATAAMEGGTSLARPSLTASSPIRAPPTPLPSFGRDGKGGERASEQCARPRSRSRGGPAWPARPHRRGRSARRTRPRGR